MNIFSNLYQGIMNVFYERNLSGEHIYYIDNSFNFSERIKKNNIVAEAHPLLTTALMFVSQLFAQAKFWIEKPNGEKIEEHWLLDLLNKPGYSLTNNDFLMSIYWIKVVFGTCIIQKKKSLGFNNPTQLRLLDPSLVKFPNIDYNKYKTGSYNGLKIKYDENGENSNINIEDLIFIRDLPIIPTNVKEDNRAKNSRFIFTSKSRINGISQTLYNTVLSLEAKEVILKTNGKELFSSKDSRGQFPLSPDEQKKVEKKLDEQYGLMKHRNRAIVTKSAVDWKSLHIAIRDLGLDESVKTDANIIFSNLQVPHDILSLTGKKSSYQNQKESMVGFLQNIMQPVVDDFSQSLSELLEDGYKVVGSYEHLPVMKYILDQKFKGITELAKALKELTSAGIPWEVALEMLDLDPKIKRDETYQNREQTEEGSSSGESGQEDNSEGQGGKTFQELTNKIIKIV